ncbi:1,2-phenylacetyl-CoA epoxidase subunit PaaD [Jannaschia seohaensis]|uniref:Ring-1,2-phenylacetyl-CoA epoxidase subunit PaaD n=1 Tax=Jannaschia seohaensis TaxID=475081 RepID=A0A2Y9A175_9RHOB|nr:1,2-phenylacetyl-CoA epoxidase subunit PaaD [Jannaschia seohaensis]PWJ21922.1 ring-1,2-phenylacetyl-CoA epoxidase subunit PaaD [Jannaschia seohaensis]SSA38200.1 ring-1,2-phenylacetyl-CoA epoxidase subunit PaaD [Jannaschia seohaensis]
MVARPAPAPVPGALADRPVRRDGPPPATEGDVWALLSQIPDPEIPVISITDLGIVREVALDGRAVRVAITPTYSGCPATFVIAIAVEAALLDAGLTPTVTSRIDPPWTTDWLTEAAREKLRRYGIAPPATRGPEACPHCGATTVTQVSRHGSTPCKAQWRCDACAEPFDYFKCH